MLEIIKINKDNEKLSLKPEKINTEKTKAYVVIEIISGIFFPCSKEITANGKIYLQKDQVKLQAKLLKIKNPTREIKIFEMEIE